MAASKIALNPVEEIVKCVESKKNFVLQGGAGSGKTESLKRVVQALTAENPSIKIACITHTNKAADEIRERINGDITVSTIHSFLSLIIKPFKKNIQIVYPELFLLPDFVVQEHDGDEKNQKKQEHERFKKAHGALEKRRKVILKDPTDKVTGKREYDKDPESYNEELNTLISEVNAATNEDIAKRNQEDFIYNDTQFNNFHEGTFGHDGLLTITCYLLDRYPMLGKIITDKYNCIFIDEYQDTNPEIIQVLMDIKPRNTTVIGLFGDSEQAIYKEGIGDVHEYVEADKLTLIEKQDNYRCSPEVIDVANQFRTDGLEQKVAYKTLENGASETEEDRKGSVVFYYAIAPKEAEAGDAQNHKTACDAKLNNLIDTVAQEHGNCVQLKLTNRSIAQNAGFGTLYSIFDARYQDTKERLEKMLSRLQFFEVAELISLYQNVSNDKRAYNRLISKLRLRGFSINSIDDKKELATLLQSLSDENKGAYSTIIFAIENKLVQKSETHQYFLDKRQNTLSLLESDVTFERFAEYYQNGANTFTRFKKMLTENDEADIDVLGETLTQDVFDDKQKDIKEKDFQDALFSNTLSFSEVMAYYQYENAETNDSYSTMHKTKGTEIENVMVVLDEYGWVKEYDFMSCFSGNLPTTEKEADTRKLLYVACSRAKRNLVLVRLVTNEDEVAKIKKFFSNLVSPCEVLEVNPIPKML